jgi:hypothetical protein
MSIQKVESIIIGSGDMTNNATASRFYADSGVPNPVLGKDGDVYMRVAGVNSDLLMKISGEWVSLAGRPVLAAFAPSLVDSLWLSLPLSSFRYAFIDYTIQRGTQYQQGRIEVLSDGTPGPSGASIIVFDINEIGGGTVGVDFSAQVNGSGTAFEVRVTTDAQANLINIKYVLKSWG